MHRVNIEPVYKSVSRDGIQMVSAVSDYNSMPGEDENVY
jgi:hypothetical protein